MFIYPLDPGWWQFPVHIITWPGHVDHNHVGPRLHGALLAGLDVTIRHHGIWGVQKEEN